MGNEKAKSSEEAARVSQTGLDRVDRLFSEFAAEFRRPLFSFFRRRGHTSDESEDLVQSTFLRAFNGWNSFQGKAQPKTWLLKIALHVHLNFIRSQKTLKRSGPEAAPNHAPDQKDHEPVDSAGAFDPEGLLLTKEKENILKSAMEGLPPQMRRCMELRVGQELKYRQIATVMKISVGTVKSQLAQARQRLQSELNLHFINTDTDVGIRKEIGVCGGSARIRNTRIPVWTLVSFRQLGCSPDQILEIFPDLAQEDLEAAWSYFQTHQREIQREIATQDSDAD